MRYLLLTLSLAFANCASTNAVGAELMGAEISSAVSIANYAFSTNSVSFPTVEVFLGIGYNITPVLGVHTALTLTEKGYNLSEARIHLTEDSRLGQMDVSVGRLVHKTSVQGARKLSPATRGAVVLPQAIDWHNAQQSFNTGTGITASLSSSSGSYVRVSREKTNIVGQESTFLSEILAIPAPVEGSIANSYEMAYVRSNFSIGYEDRTWGLRNNNIGEVPLWARTVFSSYVTPDYSLSVQSSRFENSFTIKYLGQEPGTSYSLNAAYMASESVTVYLNQNAVNFHSRLLQQYDPYHDKTIDNNLGFQYKHLNSPITVRIEYHNISGTGWFTQQLHRASVRNTQLLASQLVYEY